MNNDIIICDVIKQNESELANTIFKIQLNKATSFFCFLLLKPKLYPNRKC